MYAPEIIRRFEAKVRRGPGCHLWTGARSAGYGVVKIAGRQRGAHVVAWEIAHGPVPPGLQVLHTCDTPACVRDDHLFIGTQADNMQDASHKGRSRGPTTRGADHPRSRFTAAEVAEIRRLADDGMPRAEIRRRFDAPRSTIDHIIARRRYA